MSNRDDRVASERATAQIRELAAPVRAPQRLRAAVAQERLARGAGRAGRHSRARPLVIAGAAAAVVLALVVVLAGGQAGSPGGSVADAAQLALRAPTTVAPARTPDGYLRISNGGITFPDYANGHGWSAVGTRRDTIAGRTAVTVVYARGSRRVGYTIVDGRPLSVPSSARRVTYEGLDVAVLRRGDARYITWERDGHTCILATRAAGLAGLLELARA
jgi:hypothetical protein